MPGPTWGWRTDDDDDDDDDELLDSCGGEYEEYHLMGYDAV
jgi:hypothetical protein